MFPADTTGQTCRAGDPSAVIGRQPGAPTGAQAEYARIPLADGTLVATPDIPSDDLIPSLLAAADVLGTGEKGRYLLAATFGNVHGVYKPGNVKLRPEILQEIQDAVGRKVGGDKPFDLVFHGGSGSSLGEIHEAVSYGVERGSARVGTAVA